MNTLQLLFDGFATALTPINLLYAVIERWAPRWVSCRVSARR